VQELIRLADHHEKGSVEGADLKKMLGGILGVELNMYDEDDCEAMLMIGKSRCALLLHPPPALKSPTSLHSSTPPPAQPLP
jgi:hypothetical protein